MIAKQRYCFDGISRSFRFSSIWIRNEYVPRSTYCRVRASFADSQNSAAVWHLLPTGGREYAAAHERGHHYWQTCLSAVCWQKVSRVFMLPRSPCIVTLFWAESGTNSDDNSFKQSTLIRSKVFSKSFNKSVSTTSVIPYIWWVFLCSGCQLVCILILFRIIQWCFLKVTSFRW